MAGYATNSENERCNQTTFHEAGLTRRVSSRIMTLEASETSDSGNYGHG